MTKTIYHIGKKMYKFINLLMDMKALEQDLINHQDPMVRDYVKSVDTVMREMQAYIDYLLMDDE